MRIDIPNRNTCNSIVLNNDTFYCTKTKVEGFEVEMYDYRLASSYDFKNNNAYELRGLTFVYDDLTKEWTRHILLNKFFNINQTEEWMYDDVKNKRITRVQNKEDGSIISFVKFPNGVIRAKSKMSFTSEQAQMAQEVYNNNQNIRNAVMSSLECGYTLIFELVSPKNKIVLDYDNTDLILLQVRDVNGTYLDKKLNWYNEEFNINVTNNFPLIEIGESVLDTLLKLKTTEENIEGWVVTFEDGQMAKVKTDWYINLHGIVNNNAFRENLLIKSTLNDTIDDVISILEEGQKRDRIIEIVEKVQHKFNHLVSKTEALWNEYQTNYKNNIKDFAIKYKNEEVFSLVMKLIHSDNIELKTKELVKQHILNKTKSLSNAKLYIDNMED